MDIQHLSQFELKQICYFIALVEAGNSFSTAAKRLGIAQPPFSQRIQGLEKLLSADRWSVQLFDRSKRPIELTAAGQAFRHEAEQALFHLDRAVAQARQVSDRVSRGEVGTLRIGINNSIANTFLPEILQVFQAQFPDVEIKVAEVTLQQEIQMLNNHELDVIFQRSPSFEQNDPALFSAEVILAEYFVVALPTTHPLANQEPIPLQALADDFILLPSLDLFPFYQKVDTLCHQAGFTPKINKSVNVQGVVSLLSLVAAGLGVSILPNHVKTLERQGVSYRSLAYRSFNSTSLDRQIAVVWRKDDLSLILRQFREVVMNLPLADSW
jgi:DNA-binding transcriptional LysR family regulator